METKSVILRKCSMEVKKISKNTVSGDKKRHFFTFIAV